MEMVSLLASDVTIIEIVTMF